MDWHSSPDFPMDVRAGETVRLRVLCPIPWLSHWFKRV